MYVWVFSPIFLIAIESCFKDNVANDEDHVKMQAPRHDLPAAALKLPYPDDKLTDLIASLSYDLSGLIDKNLMI